MPRQAATAKADGLRWYDYLYILFALLMLFLLIGWALRVLGIVEDFGDSGIGLPS
jgi:hypothetical protein